MGKISDNDDFLQEWDEEYSPEYKRETVIIKQGRKRCSELIKNVRLL